MSQLLFLLFLLPLLIIIPAIWYYLIPWKCQTTNQDQDEDQRTTRHSHRPEHEEKGPQIEPQGSSPYSPLFSEKELPPIPALTPLTARLIPRLDLPPHVRTWTESNDRDRDHDTDDVNSSSGSDSVISAWLNTLPLWKTRQFNPNTLSLSVSSEGSDRNRLSDSSISSRKKSIMQVVNEEDLDIGPSTSQRGSAHLQDGTGEFVAIFLDDQNAIPSYIPDRSASFPPFKRGISDRLPYSIKDITLSSTTSKSMPHLPLAMASPPLRTAPMIEPAPRRRPRPLLSYNETQLSLSGFPLPPGRSPDRNDEKILPGLPRVTSPRSPINRLASFLQRISQESIKVVSPPWRSLKSPRSPSDLEKSHHRPFAHADIHPGLDSPTMPSPVARDFKRFSATSNFGPRQDTTYQPDSVVSPGRVGVGVATSKDTALLSASKDAAGLSAPPIPRHLKPFIPPATRPGSSFIPPPRPASTLNSPLVPKSARTPSPQKRQVSSSSVSPLNLSSDSQSPPPPPPRRPAPPPLSAIFQPPQRSRSKSTWTSSPVFRRPSVVSPIKLSFRTNKRPSSAVISPTSPASPLHKTPRFSSNTEGTFGHSRQHSDASTLSHQSRSSASTQHRQKRRSSRSLPPIPIPVPLSNQHSLPPLAFEPFRVDFKKRQRNQYDWLL